MAERDRLSWLREDRIWLRGEAELVERGTDLAERGQVDLVERGAELVERGAELV